MNISPLPYSLIAERNKNIGWIPALSELLDNSLDAGATEIRLKIEGGAQREIEISDNGVGCQDHQLIFAQGARVDHEHGTVSGRYGVGAKIALIYFWGKCEVTSWKNDRQYDTTVIWQDLVDQNSYQIAETVETASPGRGMRIRITDHYRKLQESWEVPVKLEERFWPALEIGRKITVLSKGESWELQNPMDRSGWQNCLEFSGVIHGKAYRAIAGLIIDEENSAPGFTLIKAHRIVATGFQAALKGRSVPSFQCHVWLDDPAWELTTTKDDLANDRDRSQLGRDLASHCKGLLDLAEKAGRNICLEDINTDLTCMFNDNRRMRQPAENASGTVKPEKSGRRRADTPQNAAGENKKDIAGGQIKMIEFHGNNRDAIRVKADRDDEGKTTLLIEVNTNRSDVRNLWNNPGQLKVVAAIFIAAYTSCHPEQALLSLDTNGRDYYSTFEHLMSRWMHRIANFAMT